ncbi:toll/interleukin-1 receptor domain-containing protein [Microbacterium paludicola]|uniref:toll/interleukin-1 receptor domain-containing protein n=1 Tax=Microbacterium paludicola TaxID=300019 RepID=UPI0038799A1E
MSSLAEIRHEPASALAPDAEGRTWDVFISHASEDKDEVARPLKDALELEGLTVWLDETTLRIGDSLRQKIDEGLVRSSFGVVVLSSAYFTKGWTVYELDAIIGQSVSGTQRLLPIWHGLTKTEVAAKSPTLADRLARTTATSTIEEIAAEIALVVGEAKGGAE